MVKGGPGPDPHVAKRDGVHRGGTRARGEIRARGGGSSPGRNGPSEHGVCIVMLLLYPSLRAPNDHVNRETCCEEVLESLKQKYVLGVITNGNADTKKIGIDHYFDFNISASDIDAGKPEPEIFEETLRQSGFRAEEICHVGDHPVNDVEGSSNFGMKSIWFNEKELDWPLDEKPNFKEVNSWSELERTVENF